MYYFGINNATGIKLFQDKKNNIYIIGHATVIICRGKKVFITKRHSKKKFGCLIKTDPLGNVLWSTFLPDIVKNLLTMENGNILVIGRTIKNKFSFNVSTNYYFPTQK